MANVTDVMAGVATALAEIYPTIPSKTSRREAGPDEDPLAGWCAGYPCPCFVISCPDPEPVDDFASFETICVKYLVRIGYVKPAYGTAAPRDDDPDVRQKRQDIRDALYKPTLAGVGDVWGVGFHSEAPYTQSTGGTPGVTVSTETFEFLTNEPRGF